MKIQWQPLEILSIDLIDPNLTPYPKTTRGKTKISVVITKIYM